MAKVIGNVKGFPEQELPGEGWEAFHKRQSDAFVALEDISDALPLGELAGFVTRYQVADGYASYVVARVTARSVELEYIPFGDNYQAPTALLRGLRKVDILKEQQFRKKLAAMSRVG